MKVWAALSDPLTGKTSLSKVFWVYGLLGSVLWSVIGLFIIGANGFTTRVYSVCGLLLSVYVAVATYRCADNCSSKFWARMARISAVLSLLLVPLMAYLDLSGALDLALLGGP